jgi:hypothetical protein
VEMTASELLVAGHGQLPTSLIVGARQVTALTAALRHPGPPGVAAIRVDTLAVLCRDAHGYALQSAAFIDRLSVTCLGTVLGSVGDPVASDGRVVIPVSSCLLPAGSSCDLAVVLDIDAGAPAYSLELLVPSDGIIATDANLGSAVTLVPEVGATLPISSGVTVLQVPADELVAAFTSQMPATLVSGAEGIGAFRLTLQNPAGEEAGRITVSGLRIRAADREYAPLVIGGSVAEVLAYHDEQIWAATPQLNENDSTAVLVPQSPLDVEPGQTIALDLRVRLRPEARTTSIRLGLDAPDIEVVQPDGALLAIRVTPESGSVFPFWSESGRFTARDLAGSYGNFPNPFAAGREITTFVYFLRAAASVSLRLLTPHGESVMTILDRAERPPGLQEQDVWDGRNGNGGVVRNGVYIAELVVDYADGQQERVLRKVAVVR